MHILLLDPTDKLLIEVKILGITNLTVPPNCGLYLIITTALIHL